MSYFLIAIAVYALSVFWIGVCAPWLDEQMRDQARWLREQELLRNPPPPASTVTPWVRNALALIKRVNARNIADTIVSVQPMTGRLGSIHYLNAVESRRLRSTGSPELDILQSAAAEQATEEFQQAIADLLKAQHGV